MATTKTFIDAPQQPVTYVLHVVFTVAPDSDEHLHDQQGIRAEAQSWIESLNAEVRGVCVRKAD